MLSTLVGEYDRVRAAHPRQAAEYAFAIAMLQANKGKKKAFCKWSRECLRLLGQSYTATLQTAACRHTELGGVLIPELFHEGTVHQRFIAAAAKLGCKNFNTGFSTPSLIGQPAPA